MCFLNLFMWLNGFLLHLVWYNEHIDWFLKCYINLVFLAYKWNSIKWKTNREVDKNQRQLSFCFYLVMKPGQVYFWGFYYVFVQYRVTLDKAFSFCNKRFSLLIFSFVFWHLCKFFSFISFNVFPILILESMVIIGSWVWTPNYQLVVFGRERL